MPVRNQIGFLCIAKLHVTLRDRPDPRMRGRTRCRFALDKAPTEVANDFEQLPGRIPAPTTKQMSIALKKDVASFRAPRSLPQAPRSL
jgi:hypothetical protein